MARKVTVVLVDDLDGTDAEETVTFALDGTSYEIDLSATNADALRSTLTKYVESGRRTTNARRRRRSTPAPPR